MEEVGEIEIPKARGSEYGISTSEKRRLALVDEVDAKGEDGGVKKMRSDFLIPKAEAVDE